MKAKDPPRSASGLQWDDPFSPALGEVVEAMLDQDRGGQLTADGAQRGVLAAIYEAVNVGSLAGADPVSSRALVFGFAELPGGGPLERFDLLLELLREAPALRH